MVHLSEDDLSKNNNFKEIVLKDFQSTPQESIK